MTATDYQRGWRAKRKKLAAWKRPLSPASNPPKHDLVTTRPELAARIVQHYNPHGRVLDPRRGQGAFYNEPCRQRGVRRIGASSRKAATSLPSIGTTIG